MIPIQALLLALPLLGNAPAQALGPQTPAGDTPWNLFDRVEVIVNEEIVTVSEFDRDFREFARNTGVTPTTAEESRQVSLLVAQRKVDGLLTEQGGHDLGFDEAQVRRMVANWEDSLIEEAGGVGQRSEALLEAGSAAHLEREELTGDIYRISWERAITGRDAGPLGRPTKDRYVRPGQLRRLYDQAASMPGALEQVGAASGSYRLQLLILDVAQIGTIDDALALAEEIQRRIADHESFDALIEEYSVSKGENSLLRPLSFGDLARFTQEEGAWGELARWAIESETGSISDNIYLADRGNESIQIAKLLERPEASPFLDANTQAALRKHVLDIRDGYHRGRALDTLKRAAYIWTPSYTPTEQPDVAGPPAP